MRVVTITSIGFRAAGGVVPGFVKSDQIQRIPVGWKRQENFVTQCRSLSKNHTGGTYYKIMMFHLIQDYLTIWIKSVKIKRNILYHKVGNKYQNQRNISHLLYQY